MELSGHGVEPVLDDHEAHRAAVEIGALLGKMLNSDVSDRTQNGSG